MKEMIENFNRYQIINESTGNVIKVSHLCWLIKIHVLSNADSVLSHRHHVREIFKLKPTFKTKNAKDCNFICARTKMCGSWSYNGNRFDSISWLILMSHHSCLWHIDMTPYDFFVLVTGVIWNTELEFIQCTALPVNWIVLPVCLECPTYRICII